MCVDHMSSVGVGGYSLGRRESWALQKVGRDGDWALAAVVAVLAGRWGLCGMLWIGWSSWRRVWMCLAALKTVGAVSELAYLLPRKLTGTWQIVIVEVVPPHPRTQSNTQAHRQRLGLCFAWCCSKAAVGVTCAEAKRWLEGRCYLNCTRHTTWYMVHVQQRRTPMLRTLTVTAARDQPALLLPCLSFKI